MDKYKKLTEDLLEAKDHAVEFAKDEDDGGTANLDSTFLILKGWKEEKVIEAIKNAKLYCNGKRDWIGKGYFISLNVGQGNRRTIARNRFMRVLKSKGYKVVGFDKMD